MKNGVIAPEDRLAIQDAKRKDVTDTTGERAAKKAGSGHKSDSMLGLRQERAPRQHAGRCVMAGDLSGLWLLSYRLRGPRFRAGQGARGRTGAARGAAKTALNIMRIIMQRKKNEGPASLRGLVTYCFWRRGRDSNPRYAYTYA